MRLRRQEDRKAEIGQGQEKQKLAEGVRGGAKLLNLLPAAQLRHNGS